ncbi:hypothetical protein T01_2521 [Trichinella spiralis]|uniref:Uncharacterized protein n=1 Tax=Trichinella spiralis TaxID=6334 RepID=A0A0V1B3J7_TRISP|nr:hypothetical protein T01_2521 [Trichinella spiralis]
MVAIMKTKLVSSKISCYPLLICFSCVPVPDYEYGSYLLITASGWFEANGNVGCGFASHRDV